MIELRRDGDPYLRIGHRGAATLAPENTLESFRAAVDVGVDLIEFDVLDLRLSCALQGDTILVTRDRAAGPGGKLDAYPLNIFEIEANNAEGIVHVVADDWRGALRESALFVETGYPDYDAASEMERITGGFFKTDIAMQTDGQLFF